MRNLQFIIPFTILLVSCVDKTKTSDLNPNIVLIMADDLGYGDLSCYGNPTTRTPNLDVLAANGIKFTDFHSNGAICSPTRAALMTGKYQQRTGIVGVISAKNHREVGLDLNEITIADELKKYGYNTGMFGKWHLGYAKEYNPTLQGFDEFTGFVSGNVDYHGHIDQEGYLDWWKGTEIENEKGYTTDLISELGVKYIKQNDPKKTGKPFFLYLAHEAPHYPYQRRIDTAFREIGKAKARRAGQDSISSIYKEMVEVMDEGIGKIIQSLKDGNQYENTIVLFLSDNGASQSGSNGILSGFKASAYEGGTRVPAIFSYPDKIKEGRINSQTALTIDVLPTLLDFIGRKPSAKGLDGVSIKGNLLNQTNLPERDVFFAFGNKSFIRSGDWKLIRTEHEDGTQIELYNLMNDMQEKMDHSTDNQNLVNKMAKKLELWKKEVTAGVTIIAR